MKKSIIVLSAVLGAGIAQMGLAQLSTAQPSQSSYNQALVLSKQNLEGKNYAVAEKDAQKLLASAKSPEETGIALTILGETFYRRKMYSQARDQWNKVITLSGDEDEDTLQSIAHLGLARSYTAEGRSDKSIPQYKAVVSSFEPINGKREAAPFSLALANAYYDTQQYDLAQQQLGQVIASSQNDPSFLLVALTRAGQIDMIQRKFKKSLDEFQQVLDSQEESPYIKAYAQRQILMLNSLRANHAGEGEINSGVKINFIPHKEFDSQLDVLIQKAIDDVIVGDIIIKAL